jgi:N-acetylglucosamine repressor
MKLRVNKKAGVESELLKQVRAHPGISRITLARNLQIAPATVGNYVGRLIAEGFLVENCERTDIESGRPPTPLRLNPDGGQFIGVDFEAHNIMAMAVDFSDRPLKQTHKHIEKSDSIPKIIEKIEQAIIDVQPENQRHLLAIGVGVPGVVNPVEGIAVYYKYIAHWQNVSLAAPLAKRFGVPVYLENTVRSMALGELWFGQGRGLTDWLCIGMRSGIGVGIVAGGQLQHGVDYRAGEILDWFCPASAHPAARFFTDTELPANLELGEVTSVRAILAALDRARQAKEDTVLPTHNGPLSFSDVVRAASQRDRLTLQVIEVAAETLGWAVGQLALALNPARVILAGPLTQLGEIMLHPLRKRVEGILRPCGTRVPEIVNSTMGEYSGALGAAALAVHEWKPAR